MEEIWRGVGHGVTLLTDRDTPLRTATIDGETWTSPSGTVQVSVAATGASGAEVTVTYAPPPPFAGGDGRDDRHPDGRLERHGQR